MPAASPPEHRCPPWCPPAQEWCAEPGDPPQSVVQRCSSLHSLQIPLMESLGMGLTLTLAR